MAATQQTPEQRNSLYAELWTSFVALIRSYAAAHDLAKPVTNRTLVDEGAAGGLTLRAEHKTLVLEFDAATGSGSWTVFEDDPGPKQVLARGRFEIDENSQAALSDRPGKLEMEVAAEAFTAKIFEGE